MSFILFSNEPILSDNRDVLIDKIKNEHRRIDNDWLHLHFRIMVGLVIFVFLTECLMAFVLMNTDVVTTTFERYVLKFIIAPSGLNFLSIITGALIVRSKRLSQEKKIYAVSHIFVLIAAILFTAHNVFAATFIFFIFAIMLTTIYTNYILTALTALASLLSMTFSELFIVWDLDKVSVFDSAQRLGEFLISVFILLAVFAVSLVEILYNRRKNEVIVQKELDRQLLKRKLKFDELTGVLSRQALHETMIDLEQGEHQSTCVFAIADIDHFKAINDQYGHHIGDQYLNQFAKILNDQCGEDVYRYGGDEFCLIFKNTNIKKAVAICKQVQKGIKNIAIDDHPEIKHTVSFGLASCASTMSAAELFISADKALYIAKQTRNTIQVY